ncbi:MAG: PaaI family thioesterase [Candidatus Hydrogenedentota bacterium]
MSEEASWHAGWENWIGRDHFEDLCGPMYYKKVGDEYVSRLMLEEKHMNGQGNVHGGVLMTFADYALFVIPREQLMDIGAVTISFTSEFIASADIGDLLEAKGEVIHETGRMLFVRGLVTTGEQSLLSFSGILRKVKRKAGD